MSVGDRFSILLEALKVLLSPFALLLVSAPPPVPRMARLSVDARKDAGFQIGMVRPAFYSAFTNVSQSGRDPEFRRRHASFSDSSGREILAQGNVGDSSPSLSVAPATTRLAVARPSGHAGGRPYRPLQAHRSAPPQTSASARPIRLRAVYAAVAHGGTPFTFVKNGSYDPGVHNLIPIRGTVFVELDVRISDPSEVTREALAHPENWLLSSEEDADEERALIESDLGTAVMTHIDAHSAVRSPELIEVVGTVLSFVIDDAANGHESNRVRDGSHPPASEPGRTQEDLTAVSEASLAAKAPRLRGLDGLLESIYDLDTNDDDEDYGSRPFENMDLASRERHVSLLKGVLWHASIATLDQMFDDLRSIETLTDLDSFDWEETNVMCDLPRRFRHKYDSNFARKFLVALVDVSNQLATEWRGASTVAHELALRLILNEAEATLELVEKSLPDGWRGDLDDSLLQDVDHELLYDDSLDGVEAYGPTDLGLTPMRWHEWFVPFANTPSPSPYATDDYVDDVKNAG